MLLHVLRVSTFTLGLAEAFPPPDAILVARCPLRPAAEGMMMIDRAPSASPSLMGVWHAQPVHPMPTVPMAALVAGMAQDVAQLGA